MLSTLNRAAGERRPFVMQRSEAAPVLLIEDDPRLREMLQWTLESEGLLVEAAADGDEALERAQERRPGVVVLDLMLPGRDGLAVGRALRAAFGRGLPIAVMSADARRLVAAAAALEAFAALRKPFDLDELVAAAERGLARAAS
jgi:DNA-binding response OmpR family regulator